jgi:cell division transport system permease protein
MLKFAFKEAFKSIGRAKLHFFFSLISTSIGIYLIVLSLILVFLSRQLEQKVKEDFSINIFLNDSAQTSDAQILSSVLVKKDFSKRIELITKEKAAESFIKETGEDFKEILDYNPLPLTIKLHLIEKYYEKEKLNIIINEIQNMPNVESVGFQISLFEKILTVIHTVKYYVFAFSILLSLVAIYLMYSTLRLIVQIRNEEIETMKLVGAKISLIKFPIILNGIFIGFCGSLVSLVMLFFTIYMIKHYFSQSVLIFGYWLPVMCTIGLGLFLGWIISILSLRKITLRV